MKNAVHSAMPAPAMMMKLGVADHVAQVGKVASSRDRHVPARRLRSLATLPFLLLGACAEPQAPAKWQPRQALFQARRPPHPAKRHQAFKRIGSIPRPPGSARWTGNAWRNAVTHLIPDQRRFRPAIWATQHRKRWTEEP